MLSVGGSLGEAALQRLPIPLPGKMGLILLIVLPAPQAPAVTSYPLSLQTHILQMCAGARRIHNEFSLHSFRKSSKAWGKKSENTALELLKKTTNITFQIRPRRSGFKLSVWSCTRWVIILLTRVCIAKFSKHTLCMFSFEVHYPHFQLRN